MIADSGPSKLITLTNRASDNGFQTSTYKKVEFYFFFSVVFCCVMDA